MIALRLSDIARITGGQIHPATTTEVTATDLAATDLGPDPLVDGPVVTDSREAKAGSLYVARIGEAMDGHDFVGAARAAGAVGALTSRPVGDLPCVVVPDIQAAFAALAHALLGLSPDLIVIGVTGSSGKTGTKDMLSSVLEGHGETVANVGSLNSPVGVPLTVCRITPTTKYLVLEMGSRGIGHIAYLTQIAPPRIGVVLNVGSAHVGEFGSREAVGRAKAELVQALPATGVAVLNADDPVVWGMAGLTSAHVIPVGQSAQAAVRARDISLDSQGRPSFTMVVEGVINEVMNKDAEDGDQGNQGDQGDGGTAEVALRLHGEHHVGNALAVAAVALTVGMPLQEVATALGEARPLSRWRMEVHERADGVTIVNDAYNANPDSVRAALKALAAMGEGRRTWAVLGEMRELGPESLFEHDQIGRLAIRLNLSRVVAVGEGCQPVDAGARLAGASDERSTWVPDTDAAYELLNAQLVPGDVVLLKSSRDAGLRWLGDRLAEIAEITEITEITDVTASEVSS